MLGDQIDDHTDWRQPHHYLGGLGGDALLDLGSLAQASDHARDLGQSGDLLLRQIDDLGGAKKGQQVVLAEGRETAVHRNQAGIGRRVKGLQMARSLGDGIVDGSKVLHMYAGDALWRLDQTVAVDVVSEQVELFANESFIGDHIAMVCGWGLRRDHALLLRTSVWGCSNRKRIYEESSICQFIVQFILTCQGYRMK